MGGENYDILTGTNGKEALNILQTTQETIKVIVLDWMMPEMSGIEVLQWIKKQPKLQKIPVIMQTAKSYKSDVANGIGQGAYQYLIKPFEEEVLQAMIRSAVEEFDRYQSVKEDAEKEIDLVKEYSMKIIQRKKEEARFW